MGWQHCGRQSSHAILFSYTSSTSAVTIELQLTKHKDVPVLTAIVESATLHSTFVTNRILNHFYLTVRSIPPPALQPLLSLFFVIPCVLF